MPLLLAFFPYMKRIVQAMLVVMLGWYVGDAAVRWLVGPRLPGPAAVAVKLREVQELATARIVVRTIQRGAATDNGVLVSNTDEILCRLLVTGDYGFDLSTIGAERVRVSTGHIVITLPQPRLLAPGFTVSPAEVLDQRSTRWLTDPGAGQLAAVQAARSHALLEAPKRVAELGVDREVRDTTRTALKRLLPHLLGDPTLQVTVAFDDEPAPLLPERPELPVSPGGAG